MALFPVEIEGPIASVASDGAGGAVLVVMGMTVRVSPTAGTGRRIWTPTNRRLTIAELLLPTPLAGLTKPGFVGGTAIIHGNFNAQAGRIEVAFKPSAPADQAGRPFEANPSLELGPPENVLLGPITGKAGGVFTVNGNVVVRRLDGTDTRLPGDPPQNEFGFDLNINSIIPGMPVSIDGYLSSVDGRFVGFNFVVDDPRTVLTTTAAQISITRAQGRNRGSEFDVDLRGGVTTGTATSGSRTIEVHRVDGINGTPTEKFLGRTQARVQGGGFATWRLDTSLTALGPPYDVAPSSVIARNISEPTRPFATEDDMEVRDG